MYILACHGHDGGWCWLTDAGWSLVQEPELDQHLHLWLAVQLNQTDERREDEESKARC